VTPRRLLYALLGALGFALYLWPALKAPVVLWSDSALDLAWARRAEGIVTPVVSTHHPPKPGYLLFLRTILALGPAPDAERRVVVVQSLLLWFSIAATAVFFGRRAGARYGMALYLALILSLRLRDSSSAVMSEPLAAALFLPIAAALLDPPRRAWTTGLLGLAIAALFLVRPNAGAAAIALAVVGLALSRPARQIVPLLAGFAILWAPFWWSTRVPGDPFRGMAPAFITGSVDYGWISQPERPSPEPPPFVQVRSSLENWKATFTEERGDRGRQIAWRALHGPLGTEYYDARWSRWYERATALSRSATPLLLLACVAAFTVVPYRAAARAPGVLGLLLLAGIVAQSLVLGALPRLALPFLPAVLLFGIAALPGLQGSGRRLAALSVFGLLVGLVAWQRQVLDWEWGRVESTGVRLTLAIPRGSLPTHAPATLHVRIAPLLVPTNAGLEILGPRGEALSEGAFRPLSASPTAPFLTIALPVSLLEANRRGPVELSLLSRGDYDDAHFLIFPVIPRPWTAPTRRGGSEELSPASGIASGSLDWWAHEGVR